MNLYQAKHKKTGETYHTRRGRTVWRNPGHIKSSMTQRNIDLSEWRLIVWTAFLTKVKELADV